jgi:hypothetical protein
MKLLIMQLPPTSPLCPNILLRAPFSDNVNMRSSSLSVRDQVSHPYKTTGNTPTILSLSVSMVIWVYMPRNIVRYCLVLRSNAVPPFSYETLVDASNITWRINPEIQHLSLERHENFNLSALNVRIARHNIIVVTSSVPISSPSVYWNIHVTSSLSGPCISPNTEVTT